MAKLPRRRTRRLAAALVSVVAALSAPAGADEVGRDAVDLIGTWHVLIHYQDDETAHPERLRWDDKVWIFESVGSRLRWTQYSIVVFKDKSGRFERREGRVARVVDAWEPTKDQLTQIEKGLEVNKRSERSKILKSDGGTSWLTTTRPSPASASIVTYVSYWSIDSATSKPVFWNKDVVSSGRTESRAGVTRYATTDVSEDGALLSGTFERDGALHGTFRTMRAGSPRNVKGVRKSEGQRFYEQFLGGFTEGIGTGAVSDAIAQRSQRGGEVPDELRGRVRSEIRAAIEANIRAAGGDPGAYEREVDSLARKIEKQIVDRGRSLEEVEQLLSDGKIKP